MVKKKKYTIGIPFISKAYKSKTPKNLKILGDSLVFIGSLTTFIIGVSSPPGWVAIVAGTCTMTGRFIIKCVGEL